MNTAEMMCRWCPAASTSSRGASSTRHGDRFLPTEVSVAVTERPPMLTVAEYVEQHGSREPQERP